MLSIQHFLVLVTNSITIAIITNIALIVVIVIITNIALIVVIGIITNIALIVVIVLSAFLLIYFFFDKNSTTTLKCTINFYYLNIFLGYSIIITVVHIVVLLYCYIVVL